MAQIISPRPAPPSQVSKRKRGLAAPLGLLGAAVGGALGSVAPGVGTVAGAGLGASIGGLGGSVAGPPQEAQFQRAPDQPVHIPQQGTVGRRLAQQAPPPDAQMNLPILAEAIQASEFLSPEFKQEIEGPLAQAYMVAHMQGQKQQGFS